MNETKVVKFASLSLLKVVVILFGVFLLDRVIGPSLMDINSNLAFFVGLLCFPASLVLLWWGVLWLWLAYKKDFPGSQSDA